MKIIIYSTITFFVSLSIQIVFLLFIHIRKSKNNKQSDIEEIYIRNMKLIIKIIIAFIVSIIISVITFYGLGIAELAFLRQGH